MAAAVQSTQGDVVAEMNTTPLIDVMLVLLTLLIITLPMQTNAIKIETPRPVPNPPLVDVRPVDLVIDMDGTLLWNGQAVDRKTLDAYLADAARQPVQPDIHIQADRLAKYDRVAMVLADAARAGETHVGFDDTGMD